MKRFLTLVLTACIMPWTLSACGCDDGKNVDLLFVNHSDTTIVAVVASFEDQTSGVQNADSSPLKYSESFGFEAGEYPVTVVAYGDVELRKELARLTISAAPLPGGQWIVYARDEGRGLALSADSVRGPGW